MPSTDLLLAFFVTTAVFAFIPGPAMLYAAARTLSGGRRSGLMASLGIHLGGYVHVLAAATGLSILFRAVPALYLGVKLAGAAYLIWLGITLLRANAEQPGAEPTAKPASPRPALLQSVSIEILNPKTALFFLAFLPQFVDPAATAPIWLQFAVLGVVVNAMFSVADVACVMMADAIMARLRQSSRARRLMQRAGGSILIGLGAHLALQRS